MGDEDRLAYARRLVAACRERGLGAIAVTDHHDHCFVPLVQRAAAEEVAGNGAPLPVHQRLVVFPGVELTLAVPCQALLLFDADMQRADLAVAMTALAIAAVPDGEAKLPDVVTCHHQSLESVHQELDRHDNLKGRYIVLPNVTDGGHRTLLRSLSAPKYAGMPCVGGYTDGELARSGQGNRDILAGRSKAYGNKRLAVLQTSDSRRDDHRDLGKPSTWVKWTTPTAEALRQACLAQESRICQETPTLPSRWLEGISVSNSLFMGPVEVDFNAQYNALVGGRGTGKSTILEYLRWGLCDQATSASADTPSYERRRDTLVADTLRKVDGRVEIRFRLNGVLHVVRRDSAGGAAILKAGDQPFRPCTEQELRAVLPIQAYSQKQLSNVSVRPDELVRFITAPVQERLSRLEVQATQAADETRAAFAARRTCRALAKDVHRNNLALSSLRQQIDAVRATMTGVPPEDRAVIDGAKGYALAEQTAASWKRHVSDVGSETGRLAASVTGLLAQPSRVPAFQDLAMLPAMEQEYRALLEQARAGLEAVSAYSARFSVGSAAWSEWEVALAAHKAGYQAALGRHAANAEVVHQLAALEQQLEALQSETDGWQRRLAAHQTAEADFTHALGVWRSLVEANSALLEEECRKLTDESGGAIKAVLRRSAEVTDFLERLKGAMAGSGLQRAKIEMLGAALAQPNGAALANSVLEELESLVDRDPSQPGLPATLALELVGFTAGDMRRLSERLSPDDWLSLALTPLRDVPQFSYRAREGDYIPFDNASPGQQATALLKTLLNQPGPPLIVDQPEEDLDNPVIHEVVEQIWQAKTRRQIIFASHNANLVVNGDAELVIWCDNRRQGDQTSGKIAGEGAIDVGEIRTAVKRVMEGGDRAFELRMRKYGF